MTLGSSQRISARKRSLRRRILKERLIVSPDRRHRLSDEITQRFLRSPEFQRSNKIGLYAADEFEVSTDLICETAWAQKKRVAFPRVDGPRLRLIWVNKFSDLSPGSFGIREPLWGTEVASGELDLLIVPALAYDRQGVRLGHGKGYYDLLLASPAERPRSVVGLAYGFQVLSVLPKAPWDVRVDSIVTEAGVLESAPPIV